MVQSYLPIKYKIQVPPEDITVTQFTSRTNKKEILMNAGGGGKIYPDNAPFTVDKLIKHLCLYIFDGLAPSLQVDMKLYSIKENTVNGKDFINQAFITNGELRYQEF